MEEPDSFLSPQSVECLSDTLRVFQLHRVINITKKADQANVTECKQNS